MYVAVNHPHEENCVNHAVFAIYINSITNIVLSSLPSKSLWDKFISYKKQVEKGLEMYSSCEEQMNILLEKQHWDADEMKEKQDSLK